MPLNPLMQTLMPKFPDRQPYWQRLIHLAYCTAACSASALVIFARMGATPGKRYQGTMLAEGIFSHLLPPMAGLILLGFLLAAALPDVRNSIVFKVSLVVLFLAMLVSLSPL